MTLKLNYRAQIFHNVRSHIQVTPTTVFVSPDLPLPCFKTKYIKTQKKSPMGRLFMGLIYRLNIYLKAQLLAHDNVFPDEISALSVTYFDSKRA